MRIIVHGGLDGERMAAEAELSQVRGTAGRLRRELSSSITDTVMAEVAG